MDELNNLESHIQTQLTSICAASTVKEAGTVLFGSCQQKLQLSSLQQRNCAFLKHLQLTQVSITSLSLVVPIFRRRRLVTGLIFLG